MTLSRRDAILLWLGQRDRVALEREQQSAIEGARGSFPPAAPDEEAAAAAPAPPRGVGRFLPGFLRRRIPGRR